MCAAADSNQPISFHSREIKLRHTSVARVSRGLPVTERTLGPDRIGSAAQASLSHTLSSGFFNNKKSFCSALVIRQHENAIWQTGVSILSCDRASTWLQNDIYDASRCARTYQVFVRVNASSMWKPTCVVMQPTCIANRIGRGSGKEARRSDPLRAPSPPRTYGEYSVAYGRVKRKPHDGLRQVVTRYSTVVTTTPKPLSRCEYSYELECILLKIRPTGWHCNLVDNWAHNLDLSLVTVQNVAPLLSLTS